jgi:hypothetical protein
MAEKKLDEALRTVYNIVLTPRGFQWLDRVRRGRDNNINEACITHCAPQYNTER